jgi:hypothetical protein
MNITKRFLHKNNLDTELKIHRIKPNFSIFNADNTGQMKILFTGLSQIFEPDA